MLPKHKAELLLSAIETLGTRKPRLLSEYMGIPLRTVYRWLDLLPAVDPSAHDYGNDLVPTGFEIKGVSQYIKATEDRPAQWIKTNRSQEDLDRLLQDYVDGFFEETARITVPPAEEKVYDKDIIPWFCIGDAHLGMLAHREVSGSNFDMKIAVSELLTAMCILIDEAPSCERCVINDLGDFTHYENEAGLTEASGHHLEKDSRYSRMIRVYSSLMRRLIEHCLAKFKYVDVIINQGNHSRKNDHWMAELLRNVYDTTDRVNILDNSNVFIAYKMGNTFVMCHHSDKCKPAKLAQVMATDFYKEWGDSIFRYIFIGHVHHSMVVKEHPGTRIESFNNLAPRDQYAHEGGWRSRQSITRVDLSKSFGEVGRRVLSIDEIQARINAGFTEKLHVDYEMSQPVYKAWVV